MFLGIFTSYLKVFTSAPPKSSTSQNIHSPLEIKCFLYVFASVFIVITSLFDSSDNENNPISSNSGFINAPFIFYFIDINEINILTALLDTPAF